MKLLISKASFFLIFCFWVNTIYAQDTAYVKVDSLSSPIKESGYDRRVTRYHQFWDKLIPSYLKLQYAGSMGLMSVGTGWDYGRNNQWETDIFIGFVPKYTTSRSKVTMTLKQNFIPWSIPLGRKGFRLEPLAAGLYLNTVFGSQFWSKEPERYPKGYYNFSSRLRINIYMGQRITFRIPPDKRIFAKSITLFYEVSSSDLYIASAFGNSYLKPKDYLHLSLGLKMQLF